MNAIKTLETNHNLDTEMTPISGSFKGGDKEKSSVTGSF